MREVIFREILRTLRERHWNRLLLAVSGGMDSICLADYFIRNQKKLSLDWLGIAHVHHGLRKESADLDAECVRHFAAQRNIPFFIRHLDGEHLKAKGSVEENARRARYEALHELSKSPEVRADAIVTAHHANDQAETVLMRLLRGTGIRGLSGIREVREDGVFRPFLKIPQKELLHYATSHGLEWREDESNADTRFDRNAIRHGLLKVLGKGNPDIVMRLSRLAEISQAAEEKMLSAAEASLRPFTVPPRLWPFPTEIFPDAKILALHRSAWERLSVKSPAGAAKLLHLWLDSRGISFPRRVNFLSRFKSCDGKLLFEKSRSVLWFCRFPQTPPEDNLYLFPHGESISAEWRFRMPGDVYAPAEGLSKPLKKWFEENGVPHFARDSVPLLAQGHRILEIFGTPPTHKGTL